MLDHALGKHTIWAIVAIVALLSAIGVFNIHQDRVTDRREDTHIIRACAGTPDPAHCATGITEALAIAGEDRQ